jgi:hypothetical protein
MNKDGVILPAYVDEAEARGLLRDVKPARDHEFGLMCAVLFEPDGHDAAVQEFTPPFDAFRNAMPPGAKLHITEAFRPENQAWRVVAEKVREEYLRLIEVTRPMIIYAARRLKLSRTAHEVTEALRAKSKGVRRSSVRIVGENRPSDERVEDELILSMALRLDAFAEVMAGQVHRVKQVDLLFDETDLAERYEGTIQRTREVSKNVKIVKGWDSLQSKRVQGSVAIQAKAPFRLDTHFIGGIHVVGKLHPLVLAADIVTNHLAHHLRQLPVDAALNAPSSVENWVLRERVWGVMESASEDIF